MQTTPHVPRATASLAQTTITPAGIAWDAIKVPRHLGLAAVVLIRGPVGPVIVDPWERVLYFLVLPGDSTRWDFHPTRALGETNYVVVPPPDRRKPPGPYWLNPPDGPRRHTRVDDLRDALQAAVDTARGQRPEMAMPQPHTPQERSRPLLRSAAGPPGVVAPISAGAATFLANHGDPATWTAQDFEVYLNLAGTASEQPDSASQLSTEPAPAARVAEQERQEPYESLHARVREANEWSRREPR